MPSARRNLRGTMGNSGDCPGSDQGPNATPLQVNPASAAKKSKLPKLRAEPPAPPACFRAPLVAPPQHPGHH